MIEEHLVAAGVIAASALDRARQVAEPGQSSIGPLLVRLGYLSGTDLATNYCSMLGLPRLDKSQATSPCGDTLLPVSFLREARLCPIFASGSDITVAIVDPEDRFSLQSAEIATEKSINVVVATQQEIDALIDRLEGQHFTGVDRIVSKLSAPETKDDEGEVRRLRDMAGEAPVVRLVNLLLGQAVDARASDMHIEPFVENLNVRYRIDGLLREVESPPREQARAITSRIKLIGGLDIAERRLPQDGRCQFQHDGQVIDLRISTFPTIHGESVVVRILNDALVSLDLDEIGFSTGVRAGINRVLQSPNGIFLATGPTGSGKTTTLYAALQQLNSPERKILTVEDPVEYQIDGVNQLQVKPQIGLDFPRALRSIVRQDPDVILIGEMRDLPTSQIAIQSALTGHLVLSTLHTNDAGSSVTRLLDMGIENYLVTSTVRAILAQRLIRTLCKSCRVAIHVEISGVPGFQYVSADVSSAHAEIFRAGACAHCDGSGYRGRSVIAELMPLSVAIAGHVMQRSEAATVQSAAVDEGMVPMLGDGFIKVTAGVTSLEEIARMTTLFDETIG